MRQQSIDNNNSVTKIVVITVLVELFTNKGSFGI